MLVVESLPITGKKDPAVKVSCPRCGKRNLEMLANFKSLRSWTIDENFDEFAIDPYDFEEGEAKFVAMDSVTFTCHECKHRWKDVEHTPDDFLYT